MTPDHNQANVLQTAQKLASGDARVVGLWSKDIPKAISPYCSDLSSAIHQISTESSTLLIDSSQHQSQTHTSPFYRSKKANFNGVGFLDSVSALAWQTKRDARFLFIDMVPLVKMGNHLAILELCDKIILLASQAKTNEYTLRKQINHFPNNEKVEIVLVSG